MTQTTATAHSFLTSTEITRLSDDELTAAYIAADLAWETARRSGGWSRPEQAGGWNYAQREERNALATEIHARRGA